MRKSEVLGTELCSYYKLDSERNRKELSILNFSKTGFCSKEAIIKKTVLDLFCFYMNRAMFFNLKEYQRTLYLQGYVHRTSFTGECHFEWEDVDLQAILQEEYKLGAVCPKATLIRKFLTLRGVFI